MRPKHQVIFLKIRYTFLKTLLWIIIYLSGYWYDILTFATMLPYMWTSSHAGLLSRLLHLLYRGRILNKTWMKSDMNPYLCPRSNLIRAFDTSPTSDLGAQWWYSWATAITTCEKKSIWNLPWSVVLHYREELLSKFKIISCCDFTQNLPMHFCCLAKA